MEIVATWFGQQSSTLRLLLGLKRKLDITVIFKTTHKTQNQNATSSDDCNSWYTIQWISMFVIYVHIKILNEIMFKSTKMYNPFSFLHLFQFFFHVRA